MDVKMNLIVCDVCQDPTRETKGYRVTSQGRIAATDRCEEHAAEFEALFDKQPQSRQPATGRRGGRRRSTVTIEELEARKQRGA